MFSDAGASSEGIVGVTVEKREARLANMKSGNTGNKWELASGVVSSRESSVIECKNGDILKLDRG